MTEVGGEEVNDKGNRQATACRRLSELTDGLGILAKELKWTD